MCECACVSVNSNKKRVCERERARERLLKREEADCARMNGDPLSCGCISFALSSDQFNPRGFLQIIFCLLFINLISKQLRDLKTEKETLSVKFLVRCGHLAEA